jgi:hypothetical protein
MSPPPNAGFIPSTAPKCLHPLMQGSFPTLLLYVSTPPMQGSYPPLLLYVSTPQCRVHSFHCSYMSPPHYAGFLSYPAPLCPLPLCRVHSLLCSLYILPPPFQGFIPSSVHLFSSSNTLHAGAPSLLPLSPAPLPLPPLPSVSLIRQPVGFTSSYFLLLASPTHTMGMNESYRHIDTRGRIHERTISLRFLGIILSVLRIRPQRPSCWANFGQKSQEFSSLLFAGTFTNRFYSPPPTPHLEQKRFETTLCTETSSSRTLKIMPRNLSEIVSS